MDPLTLSRLQFAATAAFHFLFVPLTLGLSVFVAIQETQYVRTGDELYLRATKFWGKLFLINFALGVVTGIALEFQFGMNWAEYSKYVGDIFGAPLAIEATLAFFLESTFIGLWAFGWNRVSKKAHLLAIWLVAFATNLSALWILLANGWMQKPMGYQVINGRAEMLDFTGVLLNPYGWAKFLHTVSSGFVVASFFAMGVSAYHLLAQRQAELFRRSFRLAAVCGLASCFIVTAFGDLSAALVARNQPSKLAAMEAIWETRQAAPYHVLTLPDESAERNSFEALTIPNLMSLLAYQDPNAEVKGLKSIPKDERPPVLPTFISFRLMVALGLLFLLLAAVAVFLAFRRRIEDYPRLLRTLVYFIPLPYLVCELGWIVAEVGRQPWIVYGVLRTSEGVSKSITTGQVLVSLGGFVLIYGLLIVADVYLLAKFARRGPDATADAHG